MYCLSCINLTASSLLVEGMICIILRGKLLFSKALPITSTSFLLVLMAWELPLNMIQFPAFIHRTEASTVTSGLASYITPTTPSGTLTFFSINPFGRLYPKITSPTGSVNLITLYMLSAFFSILCLSNFNLSSKLSDIPL